MSSHGELRATYEHENAIGPLLHATCDIVTHLRVPVYFLTSRGRPSFQSQGHGRTLDPSRVYTVWFLLYKHFDHRVSAPHCYWEIDPLISLYSLVYVFLPRLRFSTDWLYLSPAVSFYATLKRKLVRTYAYARSPAGRTQALRTHLRA